MNNQIVIYSYTSERLKEFMSEKKESDIIKTTINILDKEMEDITDNSNVYIDITSLYNSTTDKPISTEAIINEVSKHSNWHIIINSNSAVKFNIDFGAFIKEIIPINNIYKDEQENYPTFYELTEKNINSLSESLDENLYGHSQFKKDFIQQIKNYSILYNLGELKIMSLLICGKSGIGKTELAKIIHNTFYGSAKPIKINLGNYKTQGALNSLIGSPKGYYGSERGGELSNKIKNSDSKVILIDEFEKADNDIFNFFYELLEDGKFTDLSENEYNLCGYLIIFTTNLTEENYKEIIPAPLLSRFTMKSLFKEIDYPTKNKYVTNKIKKLVSNYNLKYNKDIDYNDVMNQIDAKIVKSTNNFRYLNKLIQDALITVIEK